MNLRLKVVRMPDRASIRTVGDADNQRLWLVCVFAEAEMRLLSPWSITPKIIMLAKARETNSPIMYGAYALRPLSVSEWCENIGGYIDLSHPFTHLFLSGTAGRSIRLSQKGL